MGNPGGGTIFGADRLRDLYPGGAPPAPITPAPIAPTPIQPPAPIPGSTSDSNNGLISTIVGNPSNGVPYNGATTGTTMQPGGGLLPKTGAPNTGVMIGAPTGGRGGEIPGRGNINYNQPMIGGNMAEGAQRGPVSEIVGAPQKMMTEGEWKDQFRQDAAKRAKSPGGGIVSDVVAAPAPVAPTPTPATPAAPAKVAPNAKPGETMEQFRARIARQRGK